jgi:hypothetical protein
VAAVFVDSESIDWFDALHGHSANLSEEPRRSIQGAFIRREELGTNWSTVIDDDRRARLSPVAKYLLALPQ